MSESELFLSISFISVMVLLAAVNAISASDIDFVFVFMHNGKMYRVTIHLQGQSLRFEL